ncbi:hypothetical protein [Glycomyces tarimensis]
MTTISNFDDDELALVLSTPRAVMEAAVVADGQPSPIEFVKELSAGAKEFREAQRNANDLVRSVAAALRERGQSESSGAGLPDAEEAVSTAIERTEDALALIRERSGREDAAAYGAWLLRIATRIAKASRSRAGGFLSRKVEVSAGEQAFIEQLTAAVAR